MSWATLNTSVARGFLSQIQVEVTLFRGKGATYINIKKNYGITRDESIIRCLVRTAEGLQWYPGHPGGTDPFLAPEDQATFQTLVLNACNELNCISTPIATALAVSLRQARQKKAKQLLLDIKCPGLIPSFLSKSSLKSLIFIQFLELFEFLRFYHIFFLLKLLNLSGNSFSCINIINKVCLFIFQFTVACFQS
jgi:hypothetical protein